jgi:dipeptidyl aminopeptidase/acylaminoacyl peptidase
VPASQMVKMAETIKKKGGIAELILFPNEGHGWRHALTIKTVTQRQFEFFSHILGLQNE